MVKNNLAFKGWYSYYLTQITIFVLISITIWVAHFFYSNQFGLYEDDLFRVEPMMWMNWKEAWELIVNQSNFQGRPLHDGFIFVFSWLGFRLGKLHFIYFLGYLIVTINAFIFYLLLKRISQNNFFIITATLSFCLFPADTTQAFLTHSLGLQPSLTFLLLAFHLYLSNQKYLAYVVVLGCLLCYETFFSVFMAAPLLTEKWTKNLTKKLLKHGIIMAFLMLWVIIFRKLTGESRISELKPIDAFYTIVNQMFIGPIISLKMYIYRPIQTLKMFTHEQLIFVFVFFIIFFVFLLTTKIKILNNSVKEKSKNNLFFLSQSQMIVTGFTLLILSYPLTFTVPAVEISGRASRVHSGAIIGASIIIGCTFSGLILLSKTPLIRIIVKFILAIFFSLLLGFALNIQKDYQISWQHQRQFWTDVFYLCPDVKEGDLILVDAPNLKQVEQIQSFNLLTASMPERIYFFPADWNWEFYPRLYQLNESWEKNIIENGKFKLNHDILPSFYPWEKERIIEPSKVILLKTNQDKLIRINSPLIVNNQELLLKSSELFPSLPLNFKSKPLSNYLIKNPQETKTEYLNTQ